MSKGKVKKKWQVIRPPLGSGFYLPSRKDLLKVKPGDDVKLIFQAGEDAAERMWVQVEKCGDSEEWVGRLDNDPAQEFTASVLKYKDLVRFHPLDVINIESSDDVAREVEVVSEQIIPQDDLGSAVNTINQKWYHNPAIVVPSIVTIIVGLLTAVATLWAALITKV